MSQKVAAKSREIKCCTLCGNPFERAPKAPHPCDERIFAMALSESELVLLIGQLWRCEHEQTILAHAAKCEGNSRHEKARRVSAIKALALANRLEEIGGAQCAPQLSTAPTASS